MDIVWPKPGRYVLAVSGGVDSMVLLHLLWARSQNEPGWQLTVAHFDHGIRSDSVNDRRLVERVSESYRLHFKFSSAQLGPETSEASARAARYQILYHLLKTQQAQAIITAHHQDDVIETAILNMLRGTNRKGLTSLFDQPRLKRPLLQIPKAELVKYAHLHGLEWRADATNQDTTYLRNYIRHQLVPRFTYENKQRLLKLITAERAVNLELDETLQAFMRPHVQAEKLERSWFTALPYIIALEVMAAWLRSRNLRNFDSKTLERLVVAGKVAQSGKQVDILDRVSLMVGRQYLALAEAER